MLFLIVHLKTNKYNILLINIMGLIMAVMRLGKYVKKQEPKAHHGIGLDPETVAEFDNLYAIADLTGDKMTLQAVGKFKASGSGIATFVGNDVVLFYALDNGFSDFYWVKLGTRFGLISPKLGDYWRYSDSGNMWNLLDKNLEHQDVLHQSYSARYLEIEIAPEKKRQKTDTEDSGNNSNNGMKKSPVKDLSPELLKTLGFYE